jgi:virginiamycin B lyase
VLTVVLIVGVAASQASALPRRAVSVFGVRDVASGIVRGPDGAVWAAAGDLVRIGVAGDIRYVAVPGGAPRGAGEGIAVGPDGALWYAAGQGHASGMGRYLPGDRSPTLVALPGLKFPDGIAAGADAAMWLTDPEARKLARVSMDGSSRVIDAWPVAPGDIALGADGALWISDVHAPRILRVTAAGGMRLFRLPGPGNALAMTEGPDGAVWFTRPGDALDGGDQPSRIGRITTDGQVQQFSRDLAPDAFPEGIVTGADGNLWFTEVGRSAIGRIRPDGRITNYFMFKRAPQDIASGADRALWFTDAEDGTVSRLPLSICSSRRVVRVHLHSRRNDPIRSITRIDGLVVRGVPGTGVTVTVKIDLHGYVPGPVRVILHAKTFRGHRIIYDRVFHPCAGATS